MPLQDDIGLPRDPVAAGVRMREEGDRVGVARVGIGRRSVTRRWAGLLGLRVLRRRLSRRRGLRDGESRRGKAHDQYTENSHREMGKKMSHVYLKEVLIGNRP